MPKRDDPSKLAAAEHFIEIAGSKAEAYRLIHAAKVRGSSGRPTEFFAADAQVLFDVEMMAYEYRRAGVKAPKRRALIKQAVSRKLADGKQLGKTENAATVRINYRPGLLEMLMKAYKNHQPSGDSGEFGGLEALPKLIADPKAAQVLREVWTDIAGNDSCVLPSDLLERILKLEPNHLADFSIEVAVLYSSGELTVSK
jgi:hypothetical protein